MKPTNTAAASKILLSDQAKVFGFGFRNAKLEGQLTLTEDELAFLPVSAKPVIIPTASIQAVEAGYFRVGPMPGTPILRVLHSDNVVWAVSVQDPRVWEESLRALAPNTHPDRDVPRQSRAFKVVTGIVLLVVLVLSVAIPLVSGLSNPRLDRPQEQPLRPAVD